MKEMEYKAEFLKKPEILCHQKASYADGDIDILILSLGPHPCAYLGIPIDHPLAGFDYDDIPIRVHGGLTFSREGNGEIYPANRYWYGWDYAHCDDYAGYYAADSRTRHFLKDLKRWTTKEILDDAESAAYDLGKLCRLVEKIRCKGMV